MWKIATSKFFPLLAPLIVSTWKRTSLASIILETLKNIFVVLIRFRVFFRPFLRNHHSLPRILSSHSDFISKVLNSFLVMPIPVKTTKTSVNQTESWTNKMSNDRIARGKYLRHFLLAELMGSPGRGLTLRNSLIGLYVMALWQQFLFAVHEIPPPPSPRKL